MMADRANLGYMFKDTKEVKPPGTTIPGSGLHTNKVLNMKMKEKGSTDFKIDYNKLFKSDNWATVCPDAKIYLVADKKTHCPPKAAGSIC